ncbi:MAG: hypothetical protein WEB63_10725 [Cucumibacter sp.]
MLDKILAPLALLVLVGFLGIIVWRVPDPALIVVVSIAVAACAYDFWRAAFRNRNSGR